MALRCRRLWLPLAVCALLAVAGPAQASCFDIFLESATPPPGQPGTRVSSFFEIFTGISPCSSGARPVRAARHDRSALRRAALVPGRLGLGKIVGELTAGWIIYTSDERMIDGSVVRLPFITITTARGKPMEMRPWPVDVEVRRSLGEDLAGKDSQVERAVAELLAGLGRK